MKKHYIIGLVIVLLAMIIAGLAIRGTPKEREERHMRRGDALFEQGDYEKASIEYRNAARLMPTDAEVDYRLGIVYEAQDNINNAFAAYTLAEEQNPHFHPALLKLANYYIAGGQYDQAQKRLNTVLGESPDDPQAHALHASLLLHQNDFTGAEKEAQLVLDKDPSNLTAISVLTGFYASKKDEAKAIATVNAGIARNPKELGLLMLKAQLCENARDFTGLGETYQAIFRLRPNDDFYRIHLADVLLAAGQTDAAEAALREGVAAKPDDWDMKHRLVTFLGDHRGVDVAEKEIRSYMQSDPRKDDLYFWLADLYLSHNAVDRAVTLLQEIISRDPINNAQSLNARVSLARIHFANGKKTLAEKMIALVLVKQPGNAGARFLRASIAFDEGQYQDAVSDLRSILHAQPKDKEALQLLSEVFLRQGHLDLAIDTLNQLMDMDPLNFPAEVRLAQMYNLNGDSQRALALLTEVTQSAPHYAVGWESLARISLGIRDIPKAESAIRTLSDIDGQQMTSAFLEGQVEASKGRPEKAIASYIKVINTDPSTPLAEYSLNALVRLEQSLGKLDEAVHYIETLKTDSPYTASLLGKCYVILGKADLAAAAFDKSIASHPFGQEPYLERAKLYLDENNTGRALELLSKAATAIPDDIRAPMMEAHILAKSGRYMEAIALYQELLSRNPAFDIAANNLASVIADYAYGDPGMLEKAHQVSERFAGSSNPLLLDTFAWVCYRQGDLNKALSLTVQGMELSGQVTPQVHYHYGVILLKAGKTGEAKAELQQAVTDKADYAGVQEAKDLLKKM